MITHFKISFLILTSFLMFRCAGTSKFVIQPDINLNAYKYVYLNPLSYSDGTFDKYGIGTRLSMLFTKIGLKILTESQFRNLSKEEIGQVLYCFIQHRSDASFSLTSSGYATVIIECFDYDQKKVYNGVGEFGHGMSALDDLLGATDNAFKGFAENYSGFNVSLARNPIKEIETKFQNWEIINLDKEDFKLFLDLHYSSLNPLEGVWTSIKDNQYQIGIIRDTTNSSRDFIAFIIRSDNPFWLPKQVKIEFQRTAHKNVYTTNYFMGDHSKQGTTSFLKENGLLEMSLIEPDGKEFLTTFIKNYPSSSLEGQFSANDFERKGSSGSGFLLSHTGIVVTNWHVVDGARATEVVFPQINKSYNATIALKDVSNDLALIRLTNFNFNEIFTKAIPYTVSSSKTLKQGQKVYTLGFPLGEILGTNVKLSDGLVTSIFGIQNDPRLIQISNPIQPGNSGGPLFNYSGEVVGIIVATLNAKFFYEKADIIPQNVNFAIKSDYLLNLISMLPEDSEIRKRESQLRISSLEKQVEGIAPFMVNVKSK